MKLFGNHTIFFHQDPKMLLFKSSTDFWVLQIALFSLHIYVVKTLIAVVANKLILSPFMTLNLADHVNIPNIPVLYI